MAEADHPILAGLNPEQRRAVEAIHGPLLILAGAGSGKTRVLTHRIAWMLYKGIPPWQILAVTFTNKAAAEMKERVAHLVGETAQRILVSTFHSACVRFLRRDIEVLGYKSSFTIYDSDDQLRLIRDLLQAMKIDPKVHSPQKFRGYIDSAKNRLEKPDPAQAALNDMEEKVFVAYERALKEANAVDFNDLIGLMVKMFEEHPAVREKYQDRYRYLMVDEYQDTNHAQYRLIQLLASKHRNVAVVGDDDQSIYAFRGADIRNILSFEKDFPDATTIRLERNYRSTKTILQAAGAVVSHNEGRMDKTMWTEAEAGPRVGVLIGGDEEREAEQVVLRIRRMLHEGRRPQDVAIIYRSNAASRAFEQALVTASVPHVLVGAQKFYERREIRDTISYIKLLLNPADDVAFQRVINEPPRGIGDKSLEEIIEESRIRGVPMFEAARTWAMRGKGKARRAAGEFCQLIDSLAREALTLSSAQLVREIVTRSGYEARLRDQNTVESLGRIENLQEFVASLERDAPATADPNETAVDRLQGFLDKLSLASPTESIPDADQGTVTLLTAHLAKGLEFPVVFVVGMYEGGFPHFRAMDRQEDIEEERRLVYVAFTRAREKLYVTRPRQRLMFTGGSASRQDVDPSRFLSEVPRELLDFSEAGTHERRMQEAGGGSGESRAAKLARLGFGTPEPPIRSPRAQARPLSTGLFPSAPTPPTSAPSGRFAPPSLPDDEPVRTRELEDPRQLREGVRVHHPKFGAGTIEQRSGAPNNPKLLIRFDRFGTKSLLAQYANLELIVG